MCFHVSATSSIGAKRLRRCCRDMGAHLCDLYVGASTSYYPPTPPQQFHPIRSKGNAKTRRWPTPPPGSRAPAAPQQRRAIWDKQIPLQRCLPAGFRLKKSKNAAGVARTRFGASWRRWWWSGANMHPISMAPTPRESSGTPWKVSCCYQEFKWWIPSCCALFLRVQHRPFFYTYCNSIIYIISFDYLKYVLRPCGIGGKMRRNVVHEFFENKRQGTRDDDGGSTRSRRGGNNSVNIWRLRIHDILEEAQGHPPGGASKRYSINRGCKRLLFFFLPPFTSPADATLLLHHLQN